MGIPRALLVAAAVLALGCGSSSQNHTDAGVDGASARGGAAGAGGRGAGGLAGGGMGGAVGVGGAVATGGTIGTGGTTGTGGTGGAATGIVLRGGITTLGPSPSGAIRLSNQHISARGGPTCSANICVSGGITP